MTRKTQKPKGWLHREQRNNLSLQRKVAMKRACKAASTVRREDSSRSSFASLTPAQIKLWSEQRLRQASPSMLTQMLEVMPSMASVPIELQGRKTLVVVSTPT